MLSTKPECLRVVSSMTIRKTSLTLSLSFIVFFAGLSGCSTIALKSSDSAPETSDLETKNSEISNSKLPITDPVVNNSIESIEFEKTIQKFEWKRQQTNDLSQQEFVFAPEPIVSENLWDQLGNHFFLAPAHKGQYQSYVQYYLKRPSYLKRVSIRSKPYLYYVLDEVRKREMPYEIALLPVVESGYYPFARSYVSASGLWQFMPATGHLYGLNKTWWYNGRQDVIKSTEAALTYLQKLYKINNYDWLLALASYNGGYGNVLKAKKKYLKKHPNGNPNFWNIRKFLPKETRHYVPQLLAISHIVDHYEDFNIELEPIKNEPFFTSTQIDHQMSLVKISEITDSELDLIELLNPGFLRKATPPSGEYTLLLPKESAQGFIDQYQNEPDKFKVNWAQHKIKNGESLSVIAENYHTSVRQIKKLNGMNNDRIRSGKTLLIPVPENYAKALNNSPKINKKTYNGNKHYHTVKEGESLWTIARYYNISTRKLCEWNRVSIRAPLSVGKKLEIRSSKYGKKLSYTLKTGESLWTVAQKYSVTTQELCHWNGINKTQILHPGTKLDVWIKG